MRTQYVRERSSWRDLPHWFKRSPDGSCGARSWTLHGNIENTGYSALKGQQEPSTANRVARGPIVELAGSGMHSIFVPPKPLIPVGMRASGGGTTWGIRDWLTLAIPAQVISFSGSSRKNAAIRNSVMRNGALSDTSPFPKGDTEMYTFKKSLIAFVGMHGKSSIPALLIALAIVLLACTVSQAAPT